MADENEWLALHQASAKLGVSPLTLRTWADAGHIESYRTPGGHRRFRVSAGQSPFEKTKPVGTARGRVLEHSALGHLKLLSEETEAVSLPTAARKEERELERRMIRLAVGAIQKESALANHAINELAEAFAKWIWRNNIRLAFAFSMLATLRRAVQASVVEFAFGLGEPDADELNLWLCRVSEIIDRVWIGVLEQNPKPGDA